jgi:hypothetical protein
VLYLVGLSTYWLIASLDSINIVSLFSATGTSISELIAVFHVWLVKRIVVNIKCQCSRIDFSSHNFLLRFSCIVYLHIYWYSFSFESILIKLFVTTYLSHSLSHSITKTVLPEKPTDLQLVKKFDAFYLTQEFITAFTRARHLLLSWRRWIPLPLPPANPTSWRSVLIFYSELCV